LRSRFTIPAYSILFHVLACFPPHSPLRPSPPTSLATHHDMHYGYMETSTRSTASAARRWASQESTRSRRRYLYRAFALFPALLSILFFYLTLSSFLTSFPTQEQAAQQPALLHAIFRCLTANHFLPMMPLHPRRMRVRTGGRANGNANGNAIRLKRTGRNSHMD
jgi:hypothetical protein